jgi:AraC-like DNA-binding protein
MIDNFNLIALSGGRFRCTPAWNKEASGIDQCYKVYFPVAGGARLEMDSGSFPLAAGSIYFISGFRLRRQVCKTSMEVFWVHFVPESLYLRYLLDQLPPANRLSYSVMGWSAAHHRDLCQCFDNPGREENRLRADTSPALACRLQGLLLLLVSQLLAKLDPTKLGKFDPGIFRLKPALDFMQQRYRENPSLTQIAGVAALAPNYFHRRFHQLFGVTPFNYMLSQRLNRARHLLASTDFSIKDISHAVGYEDQLYFTRVFSRQLQMSPSAYRDSHRWD